MTAPQFLEVVVSLSVQVSLLVLATSLLARLANRDALLSRIWTGCHVLILGLTVRAFVLPRLRPIALGPSWETFNALNFALLQQRIGQGLLVLWIGGTAYSIVRFLLGWFQVQRFLKTCRPLSEAKWDGVFCTEPEEKSRRPQDLNCSPATGFSAPFAGNFIDP
jgi:hypothetical protein